GVVPIEIIGDQYRQLILLRTTCDTGVEVEDSSLVGEFHLAAITVVVITAGFTGVHGNDVGIARNVELDLFTDTYAVFLNRDVKIWSSIDLKIFFTGRKDQ